MAILILLLLALSTSAQDSHNGTHTDGVSSMSPGADFQQPPFADLTYTGSTLQPLAPLLMEQTTQPATSSTTVLPLPVNRVRNTYDKKFSISKESTDIEILQLIHDILAHLGSTFDLYGKAEACVYGESVCETTAR
ncbi:hypothetical protein TELCIR_07625 [Teladorsagia circumcincta]|uniref:Uncharacterized protein n=1 Tax=Teladorsagia circumcincta TaxID=45464 RepID=A0A2G9UJV2_TELCI|nr:hypothetical protein TELCIR_07625 [Teladorsagia circumcincta]